MSRAGTRPVAIGCTHAFSLIAPAHARKRDCLGGPMSAYPSSSGSIDSSSSCGEPSAKSSRTRAAWQSAGPLVALLALAVPMAGCGDDEDEVAPPPAELLAAPPQGQGV